MQLQEYIKRNSLSLEDVKKGFILISHSQYPVVFFDEKKGRTAASNMLYNHFYPVINFVSTEVQAIFDSVAEYVFQNQKKENTYIDTMPMFIPIYEDIETLFSDEDEAMEFYSSCDYQVIL